MLSQGTQVIVGLKTDVAIDLDIGLDCSSGGGGGHRKRPREESIEGRSIEVEIQEETCADLK